MTLGDRLADCAPVPHSARRGRRDRYNRYHRYHPASEATSNTVPMIATMTPGMSARGHGVSIVAATSSHMTTVTTMIAQSRIWPRARAAIRIMRECYRAPLLKGI